MKSLQNLKSRSNFYSTGDVSSLRILPALRLANFTLNFDQDTPVYGSHNVIFDTACGFIEVGANMTGTPSFIELSKCFLHNVYLQNRKSSSKMKSEEYTRKQFPLIY